MSEMNNLTPFAATCIPSMSRGDELLTLAIVAGRFELPRPGVPMNHAPPAAGEQPPVRLEDEYTGDPPSSSLRYEGQSAYFRPGTDIYLSGLAWSPRGKPVPRSLVGLRVGPYQKGAVGFGERVWERGVVDLRPSRPIPFESLPLTYERCYGGSPPGASGAVSKAAERNPVGRGLHSSKRAAADQPLPNFEDPQALIESVGDRPPPCGFGPIARHWRPRRDFSGTYDQAWIDHRLPLWPRDLDERFFCAASPGLCAVPHLLGGELVRIVGMSPDGPFEFMLPRLHLQARFDLRSSSVRRPMVLDAVSLEPDTSSFTMIWRTHLNADPLTVGSVVVRALETWEVER